MDKSLLDGVIPFITVAEQLSFTQAARVLDVTPTAVSKAVRALERRHGVLLFQRTTRNVALTEAGQLLFKKLKSAASDVTEAFTALQGYQDRPTGTLRLTMARVSLAHAVEPILGDYLAACPDVSVEISADDSFVDIVSGNFDAGIRLGEAVQKDMVAVRLTPEIRWSIVGSPAYFNRFGRPAHPKDLIAHQAILYRFSASGMLHHWEFEADGRMLTVEVNGRVVINDRAALMRLASDGHGLAFASEMEAADYLADGRLEAVLGQFIPTDEGLFLYFPTRMQAQPKLRAFIDIATRHRRNAVPRPT